MKVAVTGGTGFVGSNLVNRLTEDHEVTAVSRNPDESAVLIDDSVESIEGDVTDPDSLDFTGFDAVVHLVALTPLFKQPRSRHLEVHLQGTRNVLGAMEDADVDRLVHMSALGVDQDIDTGYMEAKRKAEGEVYDSGLDWTVFRPSIMYGDGSEYLRFTKLLTTPYLTGLPGGGKTKFQLLWIGDAAEMIAESLEDDQHVGETYEVGGPKVYTLADSARLIYRSEGKSLRVIPIPMPLARIGLTLAEPFPFVPFGRDQYRGLHLESVTPHNDASEFGFSDEDLRTFEDYLGLQEY